MTPYNAGHFADVAQTDLGKQVWSWLNEHDNVIRMETASELGRPAVEPLATRLVAHFGQPVREDRIKQMIGHMVRQLLEARGFSLHGQGVKVRLGDLFSVASKYKR